MAQDGFTKRDWALFREKVPEWQEAYMEKLVKEYIALLSGDGAASDKFWALEKRIKEDRHRKGVILDMSRSEMFDNILSLIREGAITIEDLDDFSDGVKERVRLLLKKW
ncbi:MAG: multidrug transporter [Lachnospiraceae bacterium]|nr:multidrug transporter [Lachnospiraceae bacterium]